MHSQHTPPQNTPCDVDRPDDPQPAAAASNPDDKPRPEALAARAPEAGANVVLQDPITCADLLKEISAAFTQADEQLLMHSIARGEPKDACVILCLLIGVKQRIVERRKAEAEATACKRHPDDNRGGEVAPRHRTFVIGLEQ
ncbi:hypothetical protein PPMP20_29595 [Paraburkholderia phymatum]|uniref:Uncharacterized protein n=1 Tax=Paraburkholderia phymatum (strain DSM 17167 / CIP 108236 / LMG 21445 / STM815) TaxID=391038 RepID=B2JRT1_PARP8|nr:hypothetical protein [Paraburkholderia phymatum]ACC73850.1 hypothetical protein Bphy_4741 [Paraburkholderia phymatum STM815]